jgi:hypothetical protein
VVEVPYTLKLLIQELGTLNIGMRLITEKNVPFLDSLSYSNNMYLLKGIDETVDNSKTVIKKLLTDKRKRKYSIDGDGDGDGNNSVDINDDNVRKSLKGGDNNEIDLETQTKLNTLMNDINESGEPPETLFEDPYVEDDIEDGKYYGTDDESGDDDDYENEPLPRIEIIDEGNTPLLDVMDIGDIGDIGEMCQFPTSPNITVSPIINIGNEGMDIMGTGTGMRAISLDSIKVDQDETMRGKSNDNNDIMNGKVGEIVVDKTE